MVKRWKRGIVLITTMLSVVLVVMLVSAVVYSNIGGMRLTGAFAARESALLAAQSGVHYAITRLQEDPTWIGAPNLDEENKFNSPKGMDVIERDGNVLGRFQTPDGRPLFFRIKFNYEDGEGGFDNLNNSSSNPIRSPYVSCNNLYRTAPTRLYPADSEGRLAVKRNLDPKWGVERPQVNTTSERASYEVPKSMAVLIVEGFAGPALRDLKLSEVASLQEGKNYPSSGSAPNLAHRVVEVYVTINEQDSLQNAVAYAAGDLELTGESLLTRVEGSARNASLFGAKDVTLKVDKVNLSSGSSVQYGQSFKQLDSQGAPYQGDKTPFKRLDSQERQQIKALTWSEVKKAQGSSTLPAGWYVWKQVEGKNQLFYYPDEATYLNQKGKTNSQYRYNGPYGAPWKEGDTDYTPLYISPQDASFTLQKDTRILANGACKDFVLCYERVEGAPAVRPILGFTTPSGQQAPVLTFGDRDGHQGGNLRLESALLGQGVLSATGDITFCGPSILESEPGIGPSVYAMGDVEIKAAPTEWLEAVSPESKPYEDTNGDGIMNPGWTSFWDQFKYPAYGLGEVSKDKEAEYEKIYRDFFNEAQDKVLAGEALTAFINDLETRRKYMEKARVAFGSEPLEVLQFDDEDKIGPATVRPEAAIELAWKAMRTAIEDHGSTYLSDSKFNYGDKVGTHSPGLGLEQDSDLKAWDEVYSLVPSSLRSENYMCYKEEQLAQLISNWGRVDYRDQDLSGVIYAQGQIKIDIGPQARLNLTGTMVAYGNDPSTGKPGQGTSSDPSKPAGSISIAAQKMDLVADPAYMRGIEHHLTNVVLQTKMYAIY